MSDDGGLASFQKRMKAIPVEVRRAVVPALTQSAEEIAGLMRSMAPVEDGDLKESIKVTAPGLSTPPYSQPGGSLVVPELTSAITAGNSDVRYAHLVEHGTAPHDVSKGAATVKGRIKAAFKGGTQHPGAVAKPFFWPGFRLGRKRALARIKRAMSKAVKEAK